MNFLLELKFFILIHPVTSKQPHKIVQIHMRHPVIAGENKGSSLFWLSGALSYTGAMDLPTNDITTFNF